MYKKISAVIGGKELLPGCWVPGTVLDKLPSVAIQADSGVENEIEWIENRKENDHLSGHKLGLDLIGDPKRRN
jgi:hypothetical protein